MSTTLPARVKSIALREAAAGFLAKRRVAVTGVSRTPASHGANVIYRRLRDRGYEVFAVNPNAETVEGDNSYPDLASIPGGVDAVVVATSPSRAQATIAECVRLGIRQVWMHRSIDAGSVSHEAAELARSQGLTVIEGGCPLMFDPVGDGAHKVMRFMLAWGGRVPRKVTCPLDS